MTQGVQKQPQKISPKWPDFFLLYTALPLAIVENRIFALTPKLATPKNYISCSVALPLSVVIILANLDQL